MADKSVSWESICDKRQPTKAAAGAPIAFARLALEAQTAECIMWPFAQRSPEGYGSLYDPDTDTDYRAHRWICENAHGKPKPGEQARHKCHEPRCVNPHHLRWGTGKQNVWDSIVAGRRSIGANRPGAALTDELVAEMRGSSETDKWWALRLNVTIPTVRSARIGQTWKHVSAPPQKRARTSKLCRMPTQLVDE